MKEPRGTILVVDDEPNNIEMLSRRLQRHNYTVDSASSGFEALERLASRHYDVTLLDVMMPGLDGLGVLRKLRAQAEHANTPVIMVTAKSGSDDVAEAFDCGADDFIAKPIDFRVLLARLESQVARGQAQRHLEEMNTRLNETVEARTRHLQDMQSQLANVAENLPVVLWRLEADDEGRLRLMFLHGAVQAVLGDATPQIGEELDGILALMHPDDQAEVRSAMEALTAQHKPLAMDVRLTQAEDHRWVHLAARMASDGVGIDGILLDVHDRKHLEAQLLHTQKLESVGQLASGIAHEINSPAQYTRDNIAFLKESFGDVMGLIKAQSDALEQARATPLPASTFDHLTALKDAADLDFVMEELPAALDQSLDGIDRISRIVTAMKGFTHPGGEEQESCDLNKLIEDTATIARNEWKYVAEMTLDLDPAMPFVSCFPGELAQVVLNLIVNAAHAISDARSGDGGLGRITVTSRYEAEDNLVQIRIADDGPGVPEDLRNRIFDPFFTTKAVGKGTGQGLAMARSVIFDKHKGSLTLDESVEQGAAFVITIPA